jgi:hypothetical protein
MRSALDDAEKKTLEEWLRAHDSLWLGQHMSELGKHFRWDVVFVAPGFGSRSVGIDLALEGYRTFLASSSIEAYQTSSYHFTRNGSTVIAEYAWIMKWSDSNNHHVDRGMEVLALDVSTDAIKIFWRTQIAIP